MSAGDAVGTQGGTTGTDTHAGTDTHGGTDTHAGEAAEAEKYRLSLDVTITDAGPCKKHVRVRVPKQDIHHYYQEAVAEFRDSAEVPGFRPGHVPEKLIQRRFRKELYNQVKQQVLIDSLEQMAEEYQLDPINEPDFDVESLEIRGDRDFEYEFDVEVRPTFDLPDYEGLTIRRPTWEITEAEVENFLQRFLAQYGELVPHDGPAQPGDTVVVSIDLSHNDAPLRHVREVALRLEPILRFQDAELTGFDQLMAGVREGDVREAALTVSVEAERIEMRGETVRAVFHVKSVRRRIVPELTGEFLQRIGADSEEDLRRQFRDLVERQRAYAQRQAAREQVLAKITGSANWDLPEDLVMRQVENALRREILEMQQAGFPTKEIMARENELRQRAISTTRQALKEHFVLDKIAKREQVEVTHADIETEITMMAIQRGENPRRVRARLQKSGMIENLEAQIYERKAIDAVLRKARYEDVPVDPPNQAGVEAVALAVCGTGADVSVSSALETEESPD